ncbi:MAG: sulfatase [Acidobacteria bacterium]|nr:sulfatase [Acidobacteriota bacterium]
MNLIFIVVDTLRADYLGCYGNRLVRTPHLDALAGESALFENAHAEALPTLPARRSLYTGRRIFPSLFYGQADDTACLWRGWHGLYAEDVTLSETLRDADYTTALVSDVYHQFKPGKNFHRGFQSWRWVRGQETDYDAYGPDPAALYSRYGYVRPGGKPEWLLERYLRNRQHWRSEQDWPVARTFSEAARWLANNAGDNQPFYLHIESFSPHEYWDPPERFYDLYAPPEYAGPWLIYPPPYAPSRLEFDHIRALYSGLVTFFDEQLGRFLAAARELRALENTLVVLVADHGTFLGERGELGKTEGQLRRQLTRVPLLVRHPERPWAGRRIPGFVQHTDLMPTLLDALGLRAPERVTGESLLPLLESSAPSRREKIYIGWNNHGAIRSADWLYVGHWNGGDGWEELYDLRRDPAEVNDVLHQHADLQAQYRAELQRYVEDGWATTRGSLVPE